MSGARLVNTGRNTTGQLGFGHVSPISSFTLVGQLNGVNVFHVAAGTNHSAAVAASGEVYTWGSNGHGQLGAPPRFWHDAWWWAVEHCC